MPSILFANKLYVVLPCVLNSVHWRVPYWSLVKLSSVLLHTLYWSFPRYSAVESCLISSSSLRSSSSLSTRKSSSSYNNNHTLDFLHVFIKRYRGREKREYFLSLIHLSIRIRGVFRILKMLLQAQSAWFFFSTHLAKRLSPPPFSHLTHGQQAGHLRVPKIFWDP